MRSKVPLSIRFIEQHGSRDCGIQRLHLRFHRDSDAHIGRMLQKRVSEIHLLNVDRIPADRAGFGSTLHVTESNGEKIVYQLVMPEDADAAKGLISTTSPIGRALLNKEAGDSVKVVTPGGIREFEIDRLYTIHDEAPE